MEALSSCLLHSALPSVAFASKSRKLPLACSRYSSSELLHLSLAPRFVRGSLPPLRSVAPTHPSHTFLTVKDGLAKDEALLETAVDEKRVSTDPPSAAWLTAHGFLQCCEPGRQLKVAVLLSGGVDSSVALRLLCAAGHSCTAFYLKIWFQDNFANFWSSCPWEEDLKYAQEVCDQVGVRLKIVHLTDEYWEKVVSETIDKYQVGLSPNPDILCNSRIKFGAFLDYIQHEKFDRCASGHYARVMHGSDTEGKLQSFLLLSTDELKDQTYFLSHLSQAQLSRLSFPLGCISKVQVRQLAVIMGLPNKYRKDSQGICFLGKVKFNEFIGRHIGEKEGLIIEAETGKHMGMHKGFWFFTLGQRHGLGLSGGPWFVVEKDTKHNVVFVSRQYNSVEKQRRAFRVHSINWFMGSPPASLVNLRCKVRHGPKFYDCTFELNASSCLKEDNNSTAVITLSENDQGLAPGQYAAFYQADLCLGSGIISENFRSLQSRNVSSEAISAACLGLGHLCSPKFSSVSMASDVPLDLTTIYPHNKRLKNTINSDEAFTQISQENSMISNIESTGEQNGHTFCRFSIFKTFQQFHQVKHTFIRAFRIL